MSLNTIPFAKLPAILTDWIDNPAEKGALGMIAGPGVGKTEIWREMVTKLGKIPNYLNAGLLTLGTMNGCATPDPEFKHTLMLPLKSFQEYGEIMVDELTNAPDRSVNTGLTNLLLEGYIPGHPTKYKGSRTFACNPPATSELAEDIPRIMVNRSILFGVIYEYTDFMNFALNIGVKKIHPTVAAFINEYKNEYLQVKDFTWDRRHGVELPEPNTPFPSPRAFELLSDRIWRMERGLPTSVFEEAYATVGPIVGKKFGDFYAAARYLPRVSEILAGKNPSYPDAAFKGNKVMGPLQMMTVFNILQAAEDTDQFTNGTSWLLNQLKKETMGREILRTYAESAKGSIHQVYQHEVLNNLGGKILGGAEWTQFLLGSLKGAREASQF